MRKGLVLLALLSHPALAADNNNALDTILAKFNAITATWEPIITDAVTNLFWLLVIASFTWSAIKLWLHQKGLEHFIAELFERVMTVGFCWFLVVNASPLAWTVLNSMQEVASRLSGSNDKLSPSNIVELGLTLAHRVWESSSGFDVGQFVIIGLCGLIVLIVLALIAAQLTILLVGSYIILNGGVIVMGFLGSEWTRDHGMNYFTTVLGMSVQIFIMQLLVIIGNETFLSFINNPGAGSADYLMMVVMSVIYYALVNTVPAMASSLTTGRFVFNTAGAVNSAAGLMGAAAGIGMAAASLAKGGMGKAAQLAGKTASGQRASKGFDQLKKSSPVFKGAVSGGKAIASSAGKLGKATLGAMASQSSVGRAFRDLSQSRSVPKNAHQQMMKAMKQGGASSAISHGDAIKQATQGVKPTSNHDALKARLQQQRQQARMRK
ncbi:MULTISPECIES: P-type conjugative transfer protein TrbL [Vibrio harveyi group]|uniref:P-type conjugative transfer protein TrbL n=1 Tax=Vibrio harveyi group TaxID=717610 RepID=UPI001C90CD96|nr:P-type conjugative transfer protein TrbL [Vibrio parahaemolyticus]MBY3751256.1 P-type conjugative transfer protein TrbL [Vibrio parahaemolyticus]MBY3761881.1 P-type conjugative transfer protein TrbL [Vibrio parahaemolyticus]MBY3762800.1 P-type conjugative transfer protein TrbL [Vibrio parahaemolyticus]MBY3772722.1 P-type conjugative transfer protein TrbL [Vibrio parahaemolyticus]MBY3781614.1 P-type conjugative transfer protein TrbL [Vibrio parahaemolyticus]